MKKIILPIILVLIFVIILGGVFYYKYSSRVEMDGESQEEDPGISVDVDVEMDMVEEDVQELGAEYVDLSPEEALRLTGLNNDLMIIDVSQHYDEGHLLNSINYYLGGGDLDTAIPNLDKNGTYLVYCHVDSVSIAGAKKLAEAGFKNVYRLSGNYSAWVDSGYPVITNLEKEESALKGELKEFEDSIGSGTGYVLRGETGLSHLVKAELPDLAPGEFYEGWLVDQAPELKFFSTGRMIKTPEGDWLLEYVSEEQYEDFDYAVITLEKKADSIPEKHIIEGLVK